MDNITHTLAAVAIAKTGVGRASRLAFPAIIVAANFPDLDFVARYFGGMAAYFVYHRGVTHSLSGLLIQVPLLATLFWVIEKVFYRGATAKATGPPAAARTSWCGLGFAVALGLATQPLFDWFNTYGVRPWLPFDETWHYGDLAFIIDPWLWLLFGGAACLAGRRSRVGSIAYGGIALVGCSFVLAGSRLGSPAAPLFLQVAWPSAAAALALARWKGVGRNRSNTAVGIVAALTAAYLFGLAWAGRTAWDRYQEQLVQRFPAGEALQRYMWSPQPANPLAWVLIAETQQAVYRQPVGLLTGPQAAARFPHHLGDPLVLAALATPDGRAWRQFARFPIARVIRDSPATRVLLLDARYPVEPPQQNWCRMLIDLATGRATPPTGIAVQPD